MGFDLACFLVAVHGLHVHMALAAHQDVLCSSHVLGVCTNTAV